MDAGNLIFLFLLWFGRCGLARHAMMLMQCLLARDFYQIDVLAAESRFGKMLGGPDSKTMR